MCSPFFLIIAIFASNGFFEKVLTASISDDAIPLQTWDEPTNGYDSPNLESFSSEEGLANQSPTSPPPFPGSDGVNSTPNIDVNELAAAAEHSPSTVMMIDSTPNNPTARYPKPVCLISFWPLCCHGKIYDRFGKISECFECKMPRFSDPFSLLAYLSSLFIQARHRG